MRNQIIKLQIYLFLICFFPSFFPAVSQDWVSIVATVNDVDIKNDMGAHQISADGKTIAYIQDGSIIVKEWNGSVWQQIGNQISNNYSYLSLSLSPDGKTIAAGNNLYLNAYGIVDVYTIINQNWIQKGNGIIGELPYDNSGTRVSLSADGNTLAINAMFNGIAGCESGQARVFSWNGTQWVQKGNDIDGYTHQRFGSSLCLSADGNAFAAGSEMADLDGFGLVKVYKWDGTQWIQKGQDFNGYSKFDFLGSYTIELVNNSNTIIIGGMGYYDPLINGKCFIEVYDWNGSSWIMRGNRIVGYNSGGYFGRPLSSSEDGNIIIASETISGIKYARAYSWYGASWELMGSEIKNVSCCRLDEDGKKFIGYYYDTTTLKTVLKVYSYEQSGILALVDAKEPFMFYPNPVKEHLYFTKELNSPTILNATGEVVIQMSGNVKQVYLKELKPGLYFLKADNQLEKFLIE